MSQEKLGEAIGLTFQQVQKYERGSNRISAGTLYRLGQVLDVPVSFFFDCYDDPHDRRGVARTEESSGSDSGQISRREARLLRLWRAAPSNISDEMLSLLSSLSPDIRDPQDGPGDGTEPPSGPSGSGDGSERKVSSKPARLTRPEGPRVKSAASSDSQKPRRRHGAVWDPTDIYKSGKTGNR